ncbi:uncharacterized protein LOC111003535 [Pieris rapae]|uniref:uncharacterized protein LOC111003535 n=1 Tax=Pieris rapae TaxID=64459 RepID=UPI001E27EB8F|nr:uncharacterized protein LOC111003535 [Pieris rapae]
MEFIPQNKLLKVKADTLKVIRDEINLGKPGEMKSAVKILKEWVQQQPHFKKKDFGEHFLETTIISGKGSIERAKKQIDRVCTLRSLWPQFFGVIDIRKEFADIFAIGHFGVLPEVNENNHRVFVAQVNGNILKSSQLLNYYRYAICFGEYMRTHDYYVSYHYIVDLRQTDMTAFLASCNPIEMKQALTILIECYGIRFKGLHFITNSKHLIDMLITILKQILKPKIIQRLHHHATCDSLADFIGKDYLPVELGGTAASMQDIHNKWVEVLSSKENMEYLRAMDDVGTNEALRPNVQFNEEYAGVTGTFRFLSVD